MDWVEKELSGFHNGPYQKVCKQDDIGLKRLIIVGGGAAGFFAAIRAKTLGKDRLEVIVFESANKPLGKVKISGGGRCNVTHACFDPAQLVQYYPRNPKALRGLFSRFAPQNTVEWFESRGVKLKTEVDGRMFPITDDSQTIIDCLMREAERVGVQVRTGTPVTGLLQAPGGGFIVQTAKERIDAGRVLLATGSMQRALHWAEALGHSLIPQVPSLFTFNIKNPRLEELAGISFPHVSAHVSVDLPTGKKERITQEGPLLITHWGLSGPVILRLSAWGARLLFDTQYRARLTVDFLPKVHADTVRANLLAQKTDSPKKLVVNLCPMELPKRFWERLVIEEGVSPHTQWGEISNKNMNRLADALKACPFDIQGKGVFKDEFVTAGGIPLNEIDLKTMQSRKAEGLYFAGEIIDVDGLTGGFNFQNAWTTGWVAGEALGQI